MKRPKIITRALAKLFNMTILMTLTLLSISAANEGRRDNSILLNGRWQFALGNGDEHAEVADGQQKLNWQPVTLPGQFIEWNERAAKTIKFVWAKRTFDISRNQAEALAVLRWNRITFGAAAFINGVKVGQNEPTGPYQTILPKGVLKAGQNEFVLRIPGAGGVRKAKSGYFLIPAGFASNHRRGMPAVTDDIWIDFADTVYMKWVLAIPDLTKSKVTLRITPTGKEQINGLEITAQVKLWPDGRIIGKGKTIARLIPEASPLGGEHFYVDVSMPGFKPWTYEDCNLYIAQVQLSKDGKILDKLDLRFGMRTIEVVDGNYKLNGKNLWLRGSNLVFEWDWGDVIKGSEKEYLVTEAREMSMNSFRTHTQPLPRKWADICDEYGTMILSEFPVLYNYADYKFTPQEYDIWHKNVLTDAAGWMARLWNHPSVIMWVLSNESRNDSEWEMGPYRDFVCRLDPSRPTLRTGDTGTKENFDVHTCGNTVQTYEGKLQTQIQGWFHRSNGRTTTNTEYMNTFKRPLCQWTGTDDKEADALAYAQIGMEHTEAMRRARMDGMWPYMYAGWTKTRTGRHWKAGFAQPVSAAWHSALSPVLASLDLFNPNYVAGQRVITDLYLINDSWHDAMIRVDLLLTKQCPEFVPEAECFKKPLAKWSFDFDLGADTITKTPVTWHLPQQEGNYWLTARTTGNSGRPVLSQRFVRAVRSPRVHDSVKKRTFILLGSDKAAAAYFKSKGLTTSSHTKGLKPDENVVIIWDAARLTDREKNEALLLYDFAAAGGRIVILSTRSWNWSELCDVQIGSTGGSRVFPYEGVEHRILSELSAQYLMRWNALPGTVAVGNLKGPAVQRGKKILWVRDHSNPVVAEVPASSGDGTILFSQLDIKSHLDAAKPTYDPVAEKILLNILGQ